jgi:hypothetical protein
VNRVKELFPEVALLEELPNVVVDGEEEDGEEGGRRSVPGEATALSR